MIRVTLGTAECKAPINAGIALPLLLDLDLVNWIAQFHNEPMHLHALLIFQAESVPRLKVPQTSVEGGAKGTRQRPTDRYAECRLMPRSRQISVLGSETIGYGASEWKRAHTRCRCQCDEEQQREIMAQELGGDPERHRTEWSKCVLHERPFSATI